MVAEQHYDNDALLNLLRNRMTENSEFAQSHIESCELCQGRMETVACNGMTWNEVSGLLKSDVGATDLDDADSEPQEHWDQSAKKLLQPSDHPDSLGRFGRYEIMEVLGRGGMGIVMRGYDKALNRHSAIKVLTPELASSAAARRRFSREARSAAAVVHPHVVPIQTVDEHEGLPYLVMPVVEGQSVDSRIQQAGPLAIVEVVRIAAQVAEGLSAAHEQGLVHRDIKPANVLLENGLERVQITDFGLARAIDDASMTRSGVISGTPQYMSPEQSRGDAIDHRSDLFSLGSLIYYMLTGRSPFRAETTMGVLNRICNDAPRSLRSINPDVPEWLEHIVTKLLAKSPNDRFQTAHDVAELLENCLAHVQEPNGTKMPNELAQLAPTSNRKPPRAKLLTASAAVFLFVCLGLGLNEFNKGTIKIESDLDGVPIRIMQGDEVIQQMTVSLNGQSARIAAGTYIVEIDAKFDGAQIANGRCVLSRGETETIRITYTKASKKVMTNAATVQSRVRVRELSEPKDLANGNKNTPAEEEKPTRLLFTEHDIKDIRIREPESIVTDRRYVSFKLSDAAWIRCLPLQSQSPSVQVAVEIDGVIIGKPFLHLGIPRLGFDEATLRNFERDEAQQIVSRVWEVSRTDTVERNSNQHTTDFTSQREFYSQIQGAWALAPGDPAESPAKPRQYTSAEIRGTWLRLAKSNSPGLYEMKDFDFSKSPIQVTFSEDDGERQRDYRGLIKFDAGTLSMAIAISPSTDTPVSFTGDSKTAVFNWVREPGYFGSDGMAAVNSEPTLDSADGQTEASVEDDAETEESAFQTLQTEYQRLSSEYNEAQQAAKDDTELNRVYSEMDPRELMPARYLAFEKRHRRTKTGLKALIETAALARSVGSPESKAAKGRVESIRRIMEHYLDHEGLEKIARTLRGGPLVPQAEEFLETLVNKSPYPQTQAVALVVQISQGMDMIRAKSQLPSIRQSMEKRLERAPKTLREEYVNRFKVLDEIDVIQLRGDLNQKLVTLASQFRNIPIQTYGTGGSAASHLSHAVNKVLIGAAAPEILATDLKGKPFQLSKLKGRITVLFFTQDFSSEYGEIYGGLRQLVAKYRQMPVQAVGIMSNNDRTNLEAASKRGKLPWTVVPQEFNGPIHLDWGITGYPTVYIVDAEGILHPPLHMPYYGDGGYDTTDVIAKLDELLQEKSTPEASKEHESSDVQVSELSSSFASPAHAQTVTKLERVMKAFHQYHDKHGHFPGSLCKSTEGQGEFSHSWRIAILPFLAEQELYDDYHFDEPWDSERNLTLQPRMPDVFRSPLDSTDSVNTSWIGITSPELAASKTSRRQNMTFLNGQDGTSMKNFTDGTSNSIALVETTSPVPWTQPADIVYSADQPIPQFGGWFPNGFHAAFADGRADFLALYNSETNLRNLFTISDGIYAEPVLASRLIFRETDIDHQGNPVVNPAQPPILTETDVTSVRFTTEADDAGTQQIEFTLTREAGKRLFRETTRLSSLKKPGHIAVELDGTILSTPRVMSAISNKFVITGVEIQESHEALKQIIRGSSSSKPE